jgi:hypothetical protein
MAQEKTLEYRRRASRRLSQRGLKIPYIIYMSLAKPQDTMLASRCLSSRRRNNIPYKAYMSRGKPMANTLAKQRRVSQRLPSQSRLKIHDPRETARHDTRKATPSAVTTIVATPTQDAIGRKHEPRKPQNTTLANWRRVSRRVSTRRRLKIPFLRTWAQGRHKTRRWKIETKRRDESRRDADSEDQKKPRRVSLNNMARCWQTDDQRRYANRLDADIRHNI